MRRRFLVAYDIREDRRLREVHDVAEAFGYPVQYSVFICDLDRQERLSMELALREVMHLNVDSVVFVDLGESQGRGTECFEFLGYQPFELPGSGPTIV